MFSGLREKLHDGQTYTCGTLTYTRRGLVLLFAWMLWGDFCFTFMEAVVPSILPLKLRALEAPNTVISLVLTTLPGIFNFTITPWLSFRSDRHRGPFGRRIPFILYTAPFLAISLILIGNCDAIGAWVHRSFVSGDTYSQAKVTIILIAVLAGLFDFFNMFVNTVFWYLFNDVVPQKMTAKFAGWMRLTGTLTSAGYNFFLFKYAESHMREIYLAAALLYLVGFGIVCLRVREGKYPAISDEVKRKSRWETFQTYARDNFGISIYRDIMLASVFGALAVQTGIFSVFVSKSLGLGLDLIGKGAAVGVIAVPVCLLFAGALADRWNPVRVMAYNACFLAFFAATSVLTSAMIWLFAIPPPPLMLFWTGALSLSLFGALHAAVVASAGLPAQMALVPRDRFGQFCGAVAVIKAPASMLAGLLIGLYVDFWKQFFPENNYFYRMNFIWTGVMYVLACCFYYRVYRAWKRLGGAKQYTPPLTPYRLADLRPHPADDGAVCKGMKWLISWRFAGEIMAILAYMGFFLFWTHNLDNVRVFAAFLCLQTLLFLGLLRFLRFMERP